MQSKEWDDSSEEGFVGARYAAARHTVPDRADAAPPLTLLSIPFYSDLSLSCLSSWTQMQLVLR